MPFAAIANLVGKGIDAFVANKNANKNIKLQKQFAQQGIQWKVDDAKKAGLHPLAALGANTTSFSPVQVGSNFGDIGQDISRAMQSTQTETTKTQTQLEKLQIQRAELENAMLASQLAKNNQAGQPPSRPGDATLIDGQGNSRQIKVEPQEVSTVVPGQPHVTPGAPGEVTFSKTKGGYAVLPSKHAKELMEDMIIPEVQWSVRNQLVDVPRPPVKENKNMWYNYLTGEWKYPRYRRAPGYRYRDALRNHPARSGGPYR